MSKVSREEERKWVYVKSQYMDVSLLEHSNNLGKYNPNYKTVYKQTTSHKFSEIWKQAYSASPTDSQRSGN